MASDKSSDKRGCCSCLCPAKSGDSFKLTFPLVSLLIRSSLAIDVISSFVTVTNSSLATVIDYSSPATDGRFVHVEHLAQKEHLTSPPCFCPANMDASIEYLNHEKICLSCWCLVLQRYLTSILSKKKSRQHFHMSLNQEHQSIFDE